MRYWIYWNDLVQGPFEVNELVCLQAFTGSLLVCEETAQEWRAAADVADLEPHLPVTSGRVGSLSIPPPPPDHPPILEPLQGELFSEAPAQQKLFDPKENGNAGGGSSGPYAYHSASDGTVYYSEAETVPAVYSMPFHFGVILPESSSAMASATLEAPPQVIEKPLRIRENPLLKPFAKPSQAPSIEPGEEAPEKILPVTPSIPIVPEKKVSEFFTQHLVREVSQGRKALDDSTGVLPQDLEADVWKTDHKPDWLLLLGGAILCIVLLWGVFHFLVDRYSSHAAITATIPSEAVSYPPPVSRQGQINPSENETAQIPGQKLLLPSREKVGMRDGLNPDWRKHHPSPESSPLKGEENQRPEQLPGIAQTGGSRGNKENKFFSALSNLKNSVLALYRALSPFGVFPPPSRGRVADATTTLASAKDSVAEGQERGTGENYETLSPTLPREGGGREAQSGSVRSIVSHRPAVLLPAAAAVPTGVPVGGVTPSAIGNPAGLPVAGSLTNPATPSNLHSGTLPSQEARSQKFPRGVPADLGMEKTPSAVAASPGQVGGAAPTRVSVSQTTLEAQVKALIVQLKDRFFALFFKSAPLPLPAGVAGGVPAPASILPGGPGGMASNASSGENWSPTSSSRPGTKFHGKKPLRPASSKASTGYSVGIKNRKSLSRNGLHPIANINYEISSNTSSGVVQDKTGASVASGAITLAGAETTEKQPSAVKPISSDRSLQDHSAQIVLPGLRAAVIPGAPTPSAVPGVTVKGTGTATATTPVASQEGSPATPKTPTDPWKGRENEAIALALHKTIYGGKRTVESNAKLMLEDMHEKELLHAAQTGERLYLPDKIGWTALHQEGPIYRVYLNFSTLLASGERQQSNSDQFLVSLQWKGVTPADDATKKDFFDEATMLIHHHSKEADDIESVLGGVDAYNKQKMRSIIVKKNRHNKKELQDIQTALQAAYDKLARGMGYFRSKYPETALQNVAKAYNFVHLEKK